MTNDKTAKGRCFCGAVELTVSGDATAMGYCHCNSCREWSAGPVNAFTLWKPDQVKITKGAENIATFNKSPQSFRKWCKSCGGHLMTDHPTFGLVDVYSAIIPEVAFEPSVHLFYAEKTLAMKDGLPKEKDAPKAMGGSGQLLPE